MTVKGGEIKFYDDPELVVNTKGTTLRLFRGEDDSYSGIQPGDRFTMKIKDGDSFIEKPGVVLAYWGKISLRDIDVAILAGEGYGIDPDSDAETSLRVAALGDLRQIYSEENINMDTPLHVIVCVPEDRLANPENCFQNEGEAPFEWSLRCGGEVFGHIPAYQILTGTYEA